MTSECKPAVPGEVQHHCELYEEPYIYIYIYIYIYSEKILKSEKGKHSM